MDTLTFAPATELEFEVHIPGNKGVSKFKFLPHRWYTFECRPGLGKIVTWFLEGDLEWDGRKQSGIYFCSTKTVEFFHNFILTEVFPAITGRPKKLPTTTAPNGQDGCYCTHPGCGFHPYVEPNQANGSFICRDHRAGGAFDWLK